MADINISVQYEGTGELKAKLMEGGVTLGNEVSLQNTGDSHYTGKICHIPAGGWYTLMVTAVGAAPKEIEETALVEKVGVGDVFITGGQSNSCNFGSSSATFRSPWGEFSSSCMTESSLPNIFAANQNAPLLQSPSTVITPLP